MDSKVVVAAIVVLGAIALGLVWRAQYTESLTIAAMVVPGAMQLSKKDAPAASTPPATPPTKGGEP